jgi:hypothetical protein
VIRSNMDAGKANRLAEGCMLSVLVEEAMIRV